MKKISKISISFVLFSILIQSHCFTSANFFKTARSLGVDEEGKPDVNYQMGLGMGGEFTEALPVVFLDGSIQAALIPDVLELGADLAISTLWSFDFSIGLKYSFIQNEDFAMAFALEVADTTNIFSFFSDYSYFSIQPALLATWNLSDDLSLTLAPRAYIPLGPAPTGTAAGSLPVK